MLRQILPRSMSEIFVISENRFNFSSFSPPQLSTCWQLSFCQINVCSLRGFQSRRGFVWDFGFLRRELPAASRHSFLIFVRRFFLVQRQHSHGLCERTHTDLPKSAREFIRFAFSCRQAQRESPDRRFNPEGLHGLVFHPASLFYQDFPHTGITYEIAVSNENRITGANLLEEYFPSFSTPSNCITELPLTSNSCKKLCKHFRLSEWIGSSTESLKDSTLVSQATYSFLHIIRWK